MNSPSNPSSANQPPARGERGPAPGPGPGPGPVTPRREARAFAPARDRLRGELLNLLEAELHAPAMAAEPHPLSEEHRRRLVNAQTAIRQEIERLRRSPSAETLALTLIGRLDAGALDELDADIRFLGFRSLSDLAHEVARRAKAAGIPCQSPAPRQAQMGAGSSSGQDRQHQESLLDEGIEETFPASDPVSISSVRRPQR